MGKHKFISTFESFNKDNISLFEDNKCSLQYIKDPDTIFNYYIRIKGAKYPKARRLYVGTKEPTLKSKLHIQDKKPVYLLKLSKKEYVIVHKKVNVFEFINPDGGEIPFGLVRANTKLKKYNGALKKMLKHANVSVKSMTLDHGISWYHNIQKTFEYEDLMSIEGMEDITKEENIKKGYLRFIYRKEAGNKDYPQYLFYTANRRIQRITIGFGGAKQSQLQFDKILRNIKDDTDFRKKALIKFKDYIKRKMEKPTFYTYFKTFRKHYGSADQKKFDKKLSLSKAKSEVDFIIDRLKEDGTVISNIDNVVPSTSYAKTVFENEVKKRILKFVNSEDNHKHIPVLMDSSAIFTNSLLDIFMRDNKEKILKNPEKYKKFLTKVDPSLLKKYIPELALSAEMGIFDD